ncbi:MAG: LPS assembly lipoprotein LptE [Bacteroidia bacterium]|jgi:hypothetical protein
MKSKFNLILFWLCLPFMEACGVYSFSGASIPPEARTITIVQIENNAPIVVPILGQVLSDRMRDKFLAETGLSLADSDGDLEFEGVIVDYTVSPAAATANETTALSRLTIGVKMSYSSRINPDDDWEQSFRRFADFDASQDLASIEEQLIEEIVRQLIDDIFNKAFVNW